ncbi:MAG: Crp/Fnr family transcriptional regulator, partial [Holophagales bacterium]|nr:Crp/Fnr family transcriptional regulator [Holophagales bacterium]
MNYPNANHGKRSFLSELPVAEAEELSGLSEIRNYSSGATIFSQGEKMPGVFVVSKGAFKIFRSVGQGKIQVLDILRPGQCIGEVQVFSDGVAVSNAEARGNTECWLIPPNVLRKMVYKNPIVSEVMLRHLAAKIKHLVPLVETISLRSVPERVAQLITERYDLMPDKDFVEFKERQEELAQYIGSS